MSVPLETIRTDMDSSPVHQLSDDGFRLQTACEFTDAFIAPDFVVDGMVQRGYLYSLTGRTGDGKTAVALSLALALATGQPFGRCHVEQGRVAFFAGENADDVRARAIMAAEVVNVDLANAELHFYDRPFDIVGCHQDIEREIKRIGGCDLIIVDTLAAFFQGDEENSNTELGGFARDLRGSLCTLPGKPAVIVCAHPVKNAASKSALVPRGGGAFLAEVDGNLCVWSEDKETAELHWCTKLRGPGFEPRSFHLERRTSERVKDRKGRLIPSVVAVAMDEAAIKDAHKSARSDEDAVLDMLLNFPSASFADWCAKLGWLTGEGVANKSRVSRAIDRLHEDKFVVKERGRWKLTKKGRAEAERVVLR